MISVFVHGGLLDFVCDKPRDTDPLLKPVIKYTWKVRSAIMRWCLVGTLSFAVKVLIGSEFMSVSSQLMPNPHNTRQRRASILSFLARAKSRLWSRRLRYHAKAECLHRRLAHGNGNPTVSVHGTEWTVKLASSVGIPENKSYGNLVKSQP